MGPVPVEVYALSETETRRTPLQPRQQECANVMPPARLLVAGIRKQSDVVSSRVTIDMTIQASVWLATFGLLAARAVNIL